MNEHNHDRQPWPLNVLYSAGALFCLYFVLDDLNWQLFVRHILLDWHWGRPVMIILAYLAARTVFGEIVRGPHWQCFLYAFYGVSVFTLLAWATLGTHIEGGDPLFGGGQTVTDHVPTDIERDIAGASILLFIGLPALVGTWAGSLLKQDRLLPDKFDRFVDRPLLWIGKGMGIAVLIAFWLGMVMGSGFGAWGIGAALVSGEITGAAAILALAGLLFLGGIAVFLLLIMPIDILRGGLGNLIVWMKRR